MLGISVWLLFLIGIVFSEELDSPAASFSDEDPSLLESTSDDDSFENAQAFMKQISNGYVATGAGGSVGQATASSQGTKAVMASINANANKNIAEDVKQIASLTKDLQQCQSGLNAASSKLSSIDEAITRGLQSFQDNQAKMLNLGGNDASLLNMLSIMMTINDYLTDMFSEQFSPSTMTDSQTNLAACKQLASYGTSCATQTTVTAANSKNSASCTVNNVAQLQAECPDQGEDQPGGAATQEATTFLQKAASFIQSSPTPTPAAGGDEPSKSELSDATSKSKQFSANYEHRDQHILSSIKSGTGVSPNGNAQVIGHGHGLRLHSIITVAVVFFCVFASNL